MNDECFGMGDDSLGSYIRMMIKSGNIWFGLCFFVCLLFFGGWGDDMADFPLSAFLNEDPDPLRAGFCSDASDAQMARG